MRTKRYTLYNLSELTTDVRAKVLERYRYINVDSSWWYKPTVEDWKAKLASLGYEDPKILFSGFYCQGDGACFEARVNLEEWLARARLSGKYRRLTEAVATSDVEVAIRHTGRYCHEYSTHLETSYSGTDSRVLEELTEVESLLTEEKIALSRDIYRDLESEYEGYTDDDAVAETLAANDSEFFKDGQVANKG